MIYKCPHCGLETSHQQREINAIGCEHCKVPFRATKMPQGPVRQEVLDAWKKQNSTKQQQAHALHPQPDIFDEKRAEIEREELMEIAWPLRQLRKRKREAALIRRVEEGVDKQLTQEE